MKGKDLYKKSRDLVRESILWMIVCGHTEQQKRNCATCVWTLKSQRKHPKYWDSLCHSSERTLFQGCMEPWGKHSIPIHNLHCESMQKILFLDCWHYTECCIIAALPDREFCSDFFNVPVFWMQGYVCGCALSGSYVLFLCSKPVCIAVFWCHPSASCFSLLFHWAPWQPNPKIWIYRLLTSKPWERRSSLLCICVILSSLLPSPFLLTVWE